MLKRLSVPTGEISGQEKRESDTLEKIIRPAILVHSGPNGEKVIFNSADGEIFFDKARIKHIVRQHNKKIQSLAAGYGGVEKMPIGAFPPILDAHENDSNNRIVGRLSSLLRYEKRNVPGVGENVSCACADITFLGKDTVERVKDGRIYHLSIGIDESTDTLSETSTVITPAAPGAMLLKRGESKIGESRMQKKLAAHKAKMAKLQAMKQTLTALTGKVKGAHEQVRLTKRQGEVTHRLTGLMRSGKMTPAEFKKHSVKELAAMEEKSFNVLMSSWESREPVVMAGQKGSTVALEFSHLGKSLEKKQMKALKSECMKDMKRLNAKLSFKNGEDAEADKEHGQNFEMAAEEIPQNDPAQKDEQKLEGEENADAQLEVGDVKSEDYQKSNEDLQKQIDELNTQVARLAGMVDELMGAEKAEGEEMEQQAQEHNSLSADETPANPDEKKLGDPAAAPADPNAQADKKALGEDQENNGDTKLADEVKEDLTTKA